MFTRPMPERENDLRADLRTCDFEAFVTYGNVPSSDYLGVILEPFGSSTKSVPNGGSSGAA